jgi:hypothetical protein
MAMAQANPARVYTIHGPPGVAAAALLRDRSIRLGDEDILIIAEHDEATDAWLECGSALHLGD